MKDYIENYYVGGVEYIIFYVDGHYIVRSTDAEEIEFSGTYKNCKAYLTALEEAYLEETLF